jgi:hypothetical protein
MGRPATGYALVFVCMTLSIIPRAILMPIAPSIIKSGFGNDMCPNITAAHRATIPGTKPWTLNLLNPQPYTLYFT